MPTHRTAAAFAVSAGLAGAAWAQLSWDTHIAFAMTTGGPALPNNTLTLTATGTYTFIVRVGIFNLTSPGPGESNQGLATWTASALCAGFQPGEVIGVNASARIAPFGSGGGICCWGGYVPPSGGSISGITCSRDLSSGALAQWLWDTTAGAPAPMPTAPSGTFAPAGVASLANLYRFTIRVNTLNGPNIALAFTGSSGPVIGWSVVSSVPPQDGATPGSVAFAGLTPTPATSPYAAATLVLARCGGAMTHPVPQVVSAGDPVTFAVAVPAPGPVTYRWRRNGADLADGPRLSGVTTPTLLISPARPEDAGAYSCFISGPCPAPFTSGAAALTVACPGDFDHNNATEPADIALFINAWYQGLSTGSLLADFDHNGRIEPADIALFVTTWFTGLLNGC